MDLLTKMIVRCYRIQCRRPDLGTKVALLKLLTSVEEYWRTSSAQESKRSYDPPKPVGPEDLQDRTQCFEDPHLTALFPTYHYDDIQDPYHTSGFSHDHYLENTAWEYSWDQTSLDTDGSAEACDSYYTSIPKNLNHAYQSCVLEGWDSTHCTGYALELDDIDDSDEPDLDVVYPSNEVCSLKFTGKYGRCPLQLRQTRFNDNTLLARFRRAQRQQTCNHHSVLHGRIDKSSWRTSKSRIWDCRLFSSKSETDSEDPASS
jgi:hypothetical protein